MARVKFTGYSFYMTESMYGGKLGYISVYGHLADGREKKIYIVSFWNDGDNVSKHFPKTMGVRGVFDAVTSVSKLISEYIESNKRHELKWMLMRWASHILSSGYVQKCAQCNKERARVMRRATPLGVVCSRKCGVIAKRATEEKQCSIN